MAWGEPSFRTVAIVRSSTSSMIDMVWLRVTFSIEATLHGSPAKVLKRRIKISTPNFAGATLMRVKVER